MSAIPVGALRAEASLETASFEAGSARARKALSYLGAGFEETSRDALRHAEGMARAWDGGFKKAASAAQQQIDALTGVGRASQAASATAKRWAGELDRQAKSFDRLRASIDPVFAASKSYESAVERAESAVQSGIVSQTEANRVLEQAAQKYLGLVPAAEQAAQAEKEAALAGQAARQSYEQTRASLDPLYAASKKYETAVEQMTAAVKTGSVSQMEANKVLQLAEQRYLGVGGSTQKATAPTRGFMSLFSKERSHDLRNIAMQVSQVGQQGSVTGDYLGAAAIQAADIGTAFGVAGIAAGALVSVLGPMVFQLFDTADAAELLADESERLVAMTEGLQGSMDALSLSAIELADKYGVGAMRVRELNKAAAEIRLGDVKDELELLVAEFDASSSSMIAAQSEGREWQRAMTQLANQLGITAQEARQYNALILEIQDAPTFERQVELLEQVVAKAREGGVELGKLPATIRPTLIKMIELSNEHDGLNKLIADAEALLGNSTDQTNRWADAMMGVNSEIQAIMSSLSAIGGGMLSNAAKFVEIEALQAGKSIKAARQEAELFNRETDWNARSQGANVFEQMAIEAERWVFRSGQAADLMLDKEREAARERDKNLKKVASSSGKAVAQLEKEIDALKASLDPAEAYRQELEKLANFQGILSEDEMAKAMRNLNVELADSLPLVGDLTDSLVDGLFNGFEDGLDGIARSFEGWLKQMIGMALKNQIVLSLGITGGATVGGAAQAAGGILGGGGGLLSGAGNLLGLGGGGGILGGLGSGLGGVLSGGGLGSSFANLGGLLSGASGGLGAIGAALPALGIVLGGVALLKKAFSRKFAFSALEGTVGADGFDGYSRDFYKGGLFRSDKSVYGAIDGNLDTALDQQIAGISTSLLSMGDALGLGMDALDDYEGYFLSVMTSGRSQEQIANDISDHLRVASDQMAGLILGTSEFSRSGETASETLTRLGSSLISVNDALDLLGSTLFDASLAGGEMASQLADLFGGLDALNTSTATYWQGFYTEAERVEALTRRLSDEFAGLGLSLPTSRGAFRQLVDGLDLTTQGGRELYAELLGMAGALDQVLPQIGGLNGVLSDLVGEINTDLSAQISTAAEAQRAAEETARLWFRASDGLRDFIASLTGDVLGRSSTLDVSRSRYSTALTMASSGDMDAATDLSGLAQTYLGNARNAASTELEYRKIAAQVQGQVRAVEAIAELTGTQEDRLAALYEQQVSVLGSLQGYLQTDGVTAEGIAEFRSAIGNLDGAIQETSAFEIQSIVGLGGSIDQARDSIGLSAGLFDASGRRIISEFGSLGEQIGLSLSDFVLGIPDEVDLETSALQTALRGLENAIVADAAARERQAEIARLQQLGASASGQISARQGIGSSIVSSIEDLERRTGVQLLRNGNRDAQLSVGDQGFINYQADYFSGSSAGIAAFRAEFYGPNGLQSQIGAHNQHAVAAIQQAEALRDQLRGIGVMPAFAQGTSFAPGGFALVGEAGPEVVEVPRGSTVHPYSASRSMLDQSATVDELRRVREELHAMRSEQRQLGLSIARTNDRMLKIEKRRDALAVEVTP
ncbi:hypothetical protein [Tritonibacter scottomollicae]|uniref:hypothetical protein n=1 Tax=Tritonibacter scottomollicae TaxID=483013 RepID=UPI003AA969FC